MSRRVNDGTNWTAQGRRAIQHAQGSARCPSCEKIVSIMHLWAEAFMVQFEEDSDPVSIIPEEKFPERALECDHLLALTHGGTSDLMNGVFMCSWCNNAKSIIERWINSQHVDHRPELSHLLINRDFRPIFFEGNVRIAQPQFTKQEISRVQRIEKVNMNIRQFKERGKNLLVKSEFSRRSRMRKRRA